MSTDTRAATRWFAALLLPVGPACVAVLRWLLPYFQARDAGETIDAIAAHPQAQSAVIWLGAVATFTLVPAIFWVGRLSRRYAPRLTAAAMLVAVPGYLTLGLLGFADVAAWYGVQQGRDRAALADLFENGHPSVPLLLAVFVVGHVTGTLLLGLALLRVPAVPRWAAVLVAVSQPLHFIAYVLLGQQWLDALAWAGLAVGFAAVSVVLARTPDAEFDLPPHTDHSDLLTVARTSL